jgi:hypothetical protein
MFNVAVVGILLLGASVAFLVILVRKLDAEHQAAQLEARRREIWEARERAEREVARFKAVSQIMNRRVQ